MKALKRVKLHISCVSATQVLQALLGENIKITILLSEYLPNVAAQAKLAMKWQTHLEKREVHMTIHLVKSHLNETLITINGPYRSGKKS